MPEIETKGYESLRGLIRGEWVSMEVGDSTMTTTLRRDVGDTGPDGPAWTTADAANPQVIEMTIIGSDADVSLPTTFERVRLYAADPATDIFFDGTFSAATVSASDDELLVRVNLEVPDIP